MRAAPQDADTANPGPAFTIVSQDRIISFCFLDAESGAVRESAVGGWPVAIALEKHVPLPLSVRPMLRLGTRVYADAEGSVHLCPPLLEWGTTRYADGVVIRRLQRDIRVTGDVRHLWDVLRVMDGARSVGDIAREIDAPSEAIARLLSTLASASAVDVSGRPYGRFMHAMTKRAVLLGKLTREEIDAVARASDYRRYPDAECIALASGVPDRLRGLHAITHARRSPFAFSGGEMARAELDALLATACGVSGSLEEGVHGRAHPSAGGLYSIETYPVVFAVENLAPAVYHYYAPDHVLERVRAHAGLGAFSSAALPDQGQVVPFEGVAVAFCLCARFKNAEAKYGEGVYRALAMEVGHVSQNLILAATALGLGARPVGGYFDDLMNKLLAVDEREEAFMLSVLVGYSGESELETC